MPIWWLLTSYLLSRQGGGSAAQLSRFCLDSIYSSPCHDAKYHSCLDILWCNRMKFLERNHGMMEPLAGCGALWTHEGPWRTFCMPFSAPRNGVLAPFILAGRSARKSLSDSLMIPLRLFPTWLSLAWLELPSPKTNLHSVKQGALPCHPMSCPLLLLSFQSHPHLRKPDMQGPGAPRAPGG